MAVTFEVEHTRSSEYLIDPTLIRVKPELNGRHELPDIDDLIDGFMTLGQLQPCLIGRDGRVPVLYAGHRRWRAALEITRRKMLPNGVPFKLRCVYFQGDEKTAFLATVAENHDRKDTVEIDDAYNIVKMRRWNMTDEEIAGVYRKKTGEGKPDILWVAKRASLVDLCDEAVLALKEGRMKPTAAVAIAKLAKEAQRERITASNGHTITARIVAAPPPSELPEDAPAPRKKITIPDVRSLIQSAIDGDFGSVAHMTVENAVRVVLGELLDRMR